MKLYWYNPGYIDIRFKEYIDNGVDLLCEFNRMTTLNSIMVDRTNTISTPFNMINEFPLPAIESYTKSYYDTCMNKVVELLQRSKSENKKLAILWSGGIDSTLIVTCFLLATTEEERRNITILVSNPSIAEYPKFFYESIVPNFNLESCAIIENIWREDRIVISGEGNDQLLGSDIIKDLIALKGPGHHHNPLDKTIVRQLFLRLNPDPIKVDKVMLLLDHLMDVSPVPITTYLDYFWWINFATKWQCVYFRTLSYVSDFVVSKGLPWLRQHYTLFFEGPEFTQWALNNPAAGFKDTWHSYKWQAKDIIFDYNKDADYHKNKGKFGSLMKLAYNNVPYNFISERGWHRFLDSDAILTASHDFQ